MRYLYLIIILFFILSCERPPDFDEKPHIEYDSYRFTDIQTTLGTRKGIELTIRFEDGDGDLGLSNEDIFPPFQPDTVNGRITNPLYFNFHANLIKKVNGEFIRDTSSGLGLTSRFGYLTNPDDPGPIEGTLTRIVEQIPPFDTVKYEIFIYDRETNKSNTILTEEIIIP